MKWTQLDKGASKCIAKNGALVGTVQFNYTYGVWQAYTGGKQIGMYREAEEARQAVQTYGKVN